MILDIPKEDKGLIEVSDLEEATTRIAVCDLLMLRTGFQKHRATDPERYRWKGPGVSGDAARFLMKSFPDLRGVALDLVSLDWTEDHSHNFEAHRALLGDKQRPMFIIEDVDLAFDASGLKRILAIPLFVEEIDSGPCTVLAEFES